MKTALAVLLVLLCAVPAAADSNLYALTATMTECGCELRQGRLPSVEPEWWCFAFFESAAPAEHFTPEEPARIYAEIEGEALAQCDELQTTLPRRVRMLFWLQEFSIDFLRGITHSPIKGYHLTGL